MAALPALVPMQLPATSRLPGLGWLGLAGLWFGLGFGWFLLGFLLIWDGFRADFGLIRVWLDLDLDLILVDFDWIRFDSA